ncbi:MAG: outer membrane beta-barrel protein [bacterium]
MHLLPVTVSERVKALLFGAAALFATIPASAQVGHDPAKSPYTDVVYNQEFTLLGGYLRTRHDPANIAPQSSPTMGVRYEFTLAGPLAFSSDIFGSSTTRNVVDPLKPAKTRDLGTQKNLELGADLALAMNLTGKKSWHGLVPQVRAGAGLVRNSAKDDSSGFAIGTPFAFTYGMGVKFVPGGRFQLRADLTDHLFKLAYPDSYFRVTSDNTSVLETGSLKSFYTHHTAFTIGVSYLFAK